MEMIISLIKFDATAKKVGVTIEIEELKEEDLPELLQIVRSGKTKKITMKDTDKV